MDVHFPSIQSSEADGLSPYRMCKLRRRAIKSPQVSDTVFSAVTFLICCAGTKSVSSIPGSFCLAEIWEHNLYPWHIHTSSFTQWTFTDHLLCASPLCGRGYRTEWNRNKSWPSNWISSKNSSLRNWALKQKKKPKVSPKEMTFRSGRGEGGWYPNLTLDVRVGEIIVTSVIPTHLVPLAQDSLPLNTHTSDAVFPGTEQIKAWNSQLDL